MEFISESRVFIGSRRPAGKGSTWERRVPDSHPGSTNEETISQEISSEIYLAETVNTLVQEGTSRENHTRRSLATGLQPAVRKLTLSPKGHRKLPKAINFPCPQERQI
ncbi:hypothetical protein AVEN_141162-1 [Araneus ventricosus]|uniref:Uncharacterized protein n=1 Tax=Araneus ventricosus TaxID=182803 RepID=A0A4Y2IHH3_ARAVE|nr:hypothetical protein AVEN_141162-1 [Araneus ventricosus]